MKYFEILLGVAALFVFCVYMISKCQNDSHKINCIKECRYSNYICLGVCLDDKAEEYLEKTVREHIEKNQKKIKSRED